MTNLNDLEMRIKFLEEECRRLQDVDAIKNLKYRYWQCIDKHLWNDVGSCFADDAEVDYGFKSNR